MQVEDNHTYLVSCQGVLKSLRWSPRKSKLLVAAECPGALYPLFIPSLSKHGSVKITDVYLVFDMRYLFCEIMQAMINPHIGFDEVP